MAFSHRPTWHAARGKGSTFDLRNYSTGGVASRQISELDLPSHMKLKFREIGQGTKAEISTRDLVQELQEKEKEHFVKNNSLPKAYGPLIEDNKQKPTQENEEKKKAKGKGDTVTGGKAKAKTTGEDEIEVDYEGDADEEELKKFDDKDDVVSSDSDSDSDSDDGSDDDDEEELMRELENIKKEREEERIRKEEEAIELEAKMMRQQQMSASGVIGSLGPKTSGGAKVKRRWDQDVVFRNQAANKPENKKRFINDTIRNDFHKNFLNKYIQ
eukprot:CAMPEP_0204834514 /NCGR_PEP_ID=MMETSP1346-20131115/20027_1 /ASSEMBLY_ACC=CAM_ASM_000771 /TAXON_ID=215587 /ORGANISM="Aplanochytrium stocchinoi, Strain GSBS06" /LENGTH=270 /DNA_ID=CAMNT_0051967873 /DNA_START=203 /DNA_END=1015 /DNA_ORIENTATION=+